MNKIKALIRYEFKSLKWLFAYFMVAFGVYGYANFKSFRWNYRSFITDSISSMEYFGGFFQELNQHYALFMTLAVIGVVMLVFVQFREMKQHEVGRFLKALPVNSKVYFLTKVSCGILTYTVPFLVLSAIILGIRGMHIAWIRDVSIANGVGAINEMIDSTLYISTMLLMYYLIMTFSYLFLMLMQYLVMQPIASMIIGVGFILVPWWGLQSIEMLSYSFFQKEYITRAVREKMNYLIPWLYGFPDKGFMRNGPSIRYIDQIEVKLLILLVLSLCCIGAAYKLSSVLRVEKMDCLMPKRSIRILFVISGMIYMGFLGALIIANVSNQTSGLLTAIVGIIGGLLGYLVSYKISQIGMRERRG